MNKILIVTAFMVGYLVNDIVNARFMQPVQAASSNSILPDYSLNDIYSRILTLELNLEQHHQMLTEQQLTINPSSRRNPEMKKQISDIEVDLSNMQDSLNTLGGNLVGMANNLAFIRSNCRYRPIPAS
jgi:hypothetical protein